MLTWFVQAILDVIGAVWGWFRYAIEAVLYWFGGWLKSLLEDLMGLLQLICQWLFWQLGRAVGQMSHWFMSHVGGQEMPDTNYIMPYLNAANEWLPLDYCVGLWSTLAVVWMALAAFRWIKRFVPTLAGT